MPPGAIVYGNAVNWDNPLNRGLVGWWMGLPGQSAGPRLQDLTRNNPGTLVNGPTWAPGPTPSGAGLTLAGSPSTNRVDCGNSAVWSGSTAASWAFSVKFSSTGVGSIWSRWGNTALTEQSWIIFLTAAGKLSLAAQNSGSYQIKETTAAVSTGVWYRVVVTFTAPATVVIYLNGVSVALTTVLNNNVSALIAGTTATEIGYRTDDAGYSIAGVVADLGAWPTRALTTGDVWQDYDQSRRGYPDTLNRLRPWSFGVSSSANVTVALTGSSVTTAPGTLSPNNAIPLSGSALTISSGTTTPTTSLAITGSALSSSTGTLVPATVVPLVGSELATATGTLTPTTGITIELTGQSMSVSTGSLSPAASVPMTGSSLTTSAGTLTPVIGITIELTGLSMTTALGTILPSSAIPLTGSTLVVSTGTLSPTTSVPLSGSSIAIATGTVVPDTGLQIQLTGLEMSTSVGTLSPELEVALSGLDLTWYSGTLTPVTPAPIVYPTYTVFWNGTRFPPREFRGSRLKVNNWRGTTHG